MTEVITLTHLNSPKYTTVTGKPNGTWEWTAYLRSPFNSWIVTHHWSWEHTRAEAKAAARACFLYAEVDDAHDFPWPFKD